MTTAEPWTSGPWTTDDSHGELEVSGPEDAFVCKVYDWTDNYEANARLIALAPEMAGIMEFLADPETPTWDMEMGDCVLCGAPGVSTYQGKPHTRNCVVTESRALLARARGET